MDTRIRLLNANCEPIGTTDGHCDFEDGWDHYAYPVTVRATTSNGPAEFSMTFRAGLAVNPTNDAELHRMVRRSIADDIREATEHYQSEPDVRSLIATLAEDYGYTEPLIVYDMAVALKRASDWYWGLPYSLRTEVEQWADEYDDY